MTASVKVVENSISEDSMSLITLAMEYQNFFHPEVLTYRDKSRNVQSNRAIPGKRLRRLSRTNMAEPVKWGSNRPGMVSGEEIGPLRKWLARKIWRTLGHVAIFGSWSLDFLGVHKEISNRPLSTWIHTKVIMTATNWDNTFLQRDAPEAQPEFRALAQQMVSAINMSKPRLRRKGDWHLPYITDLEREQLPLTTLLKSSVARCARVSYLNHEGKQTTLEEDSKLYDRLASSGHMSPFEHQACPAEIPTAFSGNLQGWSQYRKMMPDEYRTGYKALNRWRVDPLSHQIISVPRTF